MANLGPALPGTAITCTSFKGSRLSMRVYFQDVHQILKEKCFDEGRSWYDGSFKVLNPDFVPLRASLACTSYNIASEKIGIHVFFVTAKGLQEMVFDGKWREGKLDIDCILGSEVAATSWGTGKDLQLRVYFQKGEHVSGISEWVFKQDKWEVGKRVLPPA
ncbi:hypothetical protein N7451_011322 [Penicillium sp. IBT 35674x]|nr:hypothetical protein N7451_011322 [Penicillium sp. IBT 35674x]